MTNIKNGIEKAGVISSFAHDWSVRSFLRSSACDVGFMLIPCAKLMRSKRLFSFILPF